MPALDWSSPGEVMSGIVLRVHIQGTTVLDPGLASGALKVAPNRAVIWALACCWDRGEDDRGIAGIARLMGHDAWKRDLVFSAPLQSRLGLCIRYS
jgi:hypothetical protein